MIRYINQVEQIELKQLKGFFVGWPNPPKEEQHLELLRNSQYKWIAIDEEAERVVGFITAISDQVLSAYIPLLEVLPQYKGRGIGTRLVEKMLDSLSEFYIVDLVCDDDIQPFYEQFRGCEGEGGNLRIKMFPCRGRISRNYLNQCGITK